MEHNLTKLYADYQEGKTDRRTFIKKLTLATGSTAAALAILPALGCAGRVKPTQNADEPITQFINYPAPKTEIRAFLAHPQKEGKFPAVVVIHENRGLQPHIQDVTKRLA